MKNQSNFNLTGNESVHQKDRPIHFNGDTQTQQIKSNSLYPAFVLQTERISMQTSYLAWHNRIVRP